MAGFLRGSDPALAETYVILSAHYDHLGMRRNGEDRIYNGANDDASGTVSVIEIASALVNFVRRAPEAQHFIPGPLWRGARLDGAPGYYVDHPLEPLDKTIAELNLEQVGRTDATDGRHIGVAFVTGYDYSNMGTILHDAARPAGIEIKKQPGDYFDRSDNITFASAGIPAHTLVVAAEFSDYHRVTDEWQKIDYANMARVDRAIALGLLQLASGGPPPQWNNSLAAARSYAEAAKKLHP